MTACESFGQRLPLCHPCAAFCLLCIHLALPPPPLLNLAWLYCVSAYPHTHSLAQSSGPLHSRPCSPTSVGIVCWWHEYPTVSAPPDSPLCPSPPPSISLRPHSPLPCPAMCPAAAASSGGRAVVPGPGAPPVPGSGGQGGGQRVVSTGEQKGWLGVWLHRCVL